MKYRNAPAHIRAAIDRSAQRWETPDGTPALVALGARCAHPHARPFSLTDSTLWCFQCGEFLTEEE